MLPDGLRALADSWVGFALLLGCAFVFLHHVLLSILALYEAKCSVVHPSLAAIDIPEGGPPPISLLVPVGDEEGVAVPFVRDLASVAYPHYEIIVVHNGAGDATLRALTEAFELRPARRTIRNRVHREQLRGIYASPRHPHLLVVDVTPGEKRAFILNTALAFSRFPYFCTLEPGTMPEPDALVRLVRPFYRAPATVAVGGVIRPSTGVPEEIRAGSVRLPRDSWVRFQVVESLRRLTECLGWNPFGAQIMVSGGFALFSRDAVQRVGGFRSNSIDEDLELVTRLLRWAARNRVPDAVRVVPDAVAWKAVPNDARVLARERVLEHQGVIESLWHGRRLLVSGTRSAFAYLSRVILEIIAPLIEACATLLFVGLIATGQGDASFSVFFLVVFAVGGAVILLLGISLEAVSCPRYRGDRDQSLLVLYAFLSSFTYRPLTTAWRLQGMARALGGRKRDEEKSPRPSVVTTEVAETRRAA